MNPQSVAIDIRMGACHLQLYLPIFFDKSDLNGIRKVFKLMTVEPERNEETREKRQQFFPEWEQDLKDQLDRAGAELKIAESEVHDIRRRVGLFGTCATREMRVEHSQKSRVYLAAQRELKNAQSALERSGKVINAYNQITQG